MCKRTANICKAPVTKGPVNNLEKHLPPDWWKKAFNSLYLKTDGDVVENPENTKVEVDLLIKAVGLNTGDSLLDLCCGPGRHCIELRNRGYHLVAGLDFSRYLIQLARKRAEQAGAEITFYKGDARKPRVPEHHFNCVAIMGNSFGYFDCPSDDIAVLKAAKNILCSGGTLFMDLADGEWLRNNFEPRSWEWINQEHFVCRERSLSDDGSRLISREMVINTSKGVIADQFYAERLYSYEQIKAVLKKIGFVAVRKHGFLNANSSRNQDLGMMSQRFILTAQN